MIDILTYLFEKVIEGASKPEILMANKNPKVV
jgi:hypothetical protein